jgi:riboflavin kinase/FMN adenylyltransferase
VKSYSTLKNSITSIAVGGFDGMHLAHQELFKKLDTSTGAIIVIETGYASLTPKTSREEYTDFPIYYYPLESIKHLNGIQFINLLIKEFPKLMKIIIGYDFHFGENRKYSIDYLKENFKGEVLVIKEISVNNMAIHSRVIRKYISNGDIQSANILLGNPYKIKGYYIKGQGLGTKQFVPTINIQCKKFLLPQDGIYASITIINDKEFKSISFIGHRISTDGKYSIETHILNKNIKYISKNIEIKFLIKIRDNKKFDTYEDLKIQILYDIKVVNIMFKSFPTHHQT